MISIATNDHSTLATSGFVKSPCISICQMGAAGLCEGCWRTLDEIAAWGGLADADKLKVLAQVRQRKQHAKQANT